MRQPNAIDMIIAKNIKTIRIRRNISLQEVVPKIGITYQQLQKYESGINRISAGRLWQLSIIYRTPIQGFFDTNS